VVPRHGWHLDSERSYFLGPIINRKSWGYVGVEVISVTYQFFDYLSAVLWVIHFIVVESPKVSLKNIHGISTEKDLDLAFEVFIYIPNLLYIGCEVFTLWFNIFVHSLFWSNKTLTKCYSLWTCKRKHGGDGKKDGKGFFKEI